MSKPVLTYFNGRGLGEPIRWMLAACDIDYDEKFLTSKENYQELVASGSLTFQQVPLLEIDGMKLVQSKAIIRYLARRGNLYGSDVKEQYLIDLYMDGLFDMLLPLLTLPFQPKDKQPEAWEKGRKKAQDRYLPVLEKALSESKHGHLANGNNMSMADVYLLYIILWFLEEDETFVDDYPTLKKWVEEKKSVPWVAKFLEPGSKRKPPPDDVYVTLVKSIIYS